MLTSQDKLSNKQDGSITISDMTRLRAGTKQTLKERETWNEPLLNLVWLCRLLQVMNVIINSQN